MIELTFRCRICRSVFDRTPQAGDVIVHVEICDLCLELVGDSAAGDY